MQDAIVTFKNSISLGLFDPLLAGDILDQKIFKVFSREDNNSSKESVRSMKSTGKSSEKYFKTGKVLSLR